MKATVILVFCALVAFALCASATPNSDNDIRTLNYALTLEHLEAAFYNTFQAQYTAAQFTAAGYNASVYNYLSVIQAHENAHVSALTSTISGLGGSPVMACTYNFAAVTNVSMYLNIAALLEGTGVSAYDGAINTLSDHGLQQVAATIATVEARHASYINKVLMQNSFPSAFDVPLSPEEVVAAAGSFFVSCPYEFDLPTIRPGGVSLNGNGDVLQTGDEAYMGEYTQAQQRNDIAALNYALALEHLEAAFYTKYQAQFSAAQFTAAGYNSSVYTYLDLIRAHEVGHVAALTSIVSGRGGVPAPECTYNFGTITTVAQYLAAAAVFEATGVSAYDGAVNTFTDTGLQEAAATIATVEARHAAYINAVLGSSPFPSAVDSATAPAAILAAVSSYISSCGNYTFQPLPQVIQAAAPSPAPSSSPTPTPSPTETPSPSKNSKTTMNFLFDGMIPSGAGNCGCQ